MPEPIITSDRRLLPPGDQLYRCCGILLLVIGETFAAHEHPVTLATDRQTTGGWQYPVAYTLAWQAVGIGIIQGLDREKTNFDDPSWDNFKAGWEKGPRTDDDENHWNFVAHPLWGSETYLRWRSQGNGPWSSLAFSATASATWEFVYESWYQRPSSQDLLITPLTGMVVGELRYQALLHLHQMPGTWPRVGRIVLDPLQSLTAAGGRRFGADFSEPAYQPRDVHLSWIPPYSLLWDDDYATGLRVDVRF